MQGKTTKEEEFEKIYQRYRHDIYKLSLYYTQDEYTADDIAQKIFFKLYLHFEEAQEIEDIGSYLRRAARNLSYNWIRHMNFESRGEYIDNIPEEHIILHSAEDNYLKTERVERMQVFLAEILEELSQENESWYEIFSLIYCLGKTHEQAAEELGMTLQVLYSKFYRAKRWIRKRFEYEFQEIVEGRSE